MSAPYQPRAVPACVYHAIKHRRASAPINAALKLMRTFAGIAALAFLVPLVLIVVGGWRHFWFYRGSKEVTGKVSEVFLRDWIDDEAQPTKRYFASVSYAVNGDWYLLSDWGPHVEPPYVGVTVKVRYVSSDPINSKVWPKGSMWWLIAPFTICLTLEAAALRVWLF